MTTNVEALVGKRVAVLTSVDYRQIPFPLDQPEWTEGTLLSVSESALVIDTGAVFPAVVPRKYITDVVAK